MAGALDTVQEILTGMIHGTQMHADLQRAQDEHDLMERNAVQQARNNRIEDIKNRMMLDQNSRPISAAGTVQDDPRAMPNILSSMTQSSSPGVDGDGNPLPALGQLGGPLSTMQTMLPGAIRKADKSRSLDYVTQDGQKISRELYTPQEQMSRMLDADTREGLAKGTIVAISGDTPIGKQIGLKPGQTANLPPSHVAGLLNAGTQDEMVDPTENMKTYSGITDQVPRRGFAAMSAAADRAKAAKDAADAKAAKDAADAAAKKTKPVWEGLNNKGDLTQVFADGTTKTVPKVGKTAKPAAGTDVPAVGVADPGALPNGIGQAPTVAQAAVFLKAAGGDREKAKEMLKAHRFRVAE